MKVNDGTKKYYDVNDTIAGYCTINFEYGKDDFVLDYIDIDDIDERKRFEGKKFRDLNQKELEDAFRAAFYCLIYNSCAEINVNVEICD